MNTMYTLLIFILLIGIYAYLCSPLEPFVSTGFQIHDDFYKTNRVEELTRVKHIIIIPFIGMNKLNFFSKKVKEIDTSFDNVYIFSVDVDNETIVSKTKEFFSTICPDIIDVSSTQAVVLTKNNNIDISQKYMFSESTDTVLIHKVNSILRTTIK